jgi:alpha-beta hydrolase superfamily lysophospholipase
MAKEITSDLHVRDALRLHVKEWLPERVSSRAECRAGVMIIHGLGEHSGRYAALADWFTRRDFAVLAYDQRGHGKSGGMQGDMLRPSDYVAHGLEVLMHFKKALGRRPFLFGHSLGGTVAASMVIERQAPVAGLILSSPALDPGLNRLQLLLLSLMEKFAPKMAVSNGLKVKYISHDPEVVKAYRADPLVHDRVTTKPVRWLIDTCERLSVPNRPLMVPTLLMAAQDDRLVNPQGSDSFARHYAEADMTYHALEGYYHEIFNEDNARREKALALLGGWLDQYAKDMPIVSRRAAM